MTIMIHDLLALNRFTTRLSTATLHHVCFNGSVPCKPELAMSLLDPTPATVGEKNVWGEESQVFFWGGRCPSLPKEQSLKALEEWSRPINQKADDVTPFKTHVYLSTCIR